MDRSKLRKVIHSRVIDGDSDEARDESSGSSDPNDGVLCVIKSDNTIIDIQEYINSLEFGRLGLITIIYSKGRATSNSIAIMTRDLYDHLSKCKNVRDIEIKGIEPYIITDSHIPSIHQNKDIFLRFEYLNSTPKGSGYVNSTKLGKYIHAMIEQLSQFDILEINNYFTVDIPLADRVHVKKPMDHAFVKFTESAPIHACIYVRSILNGHSTSIDGIQIRMTAFWCSKGK